jgi:hypothetical protein
MYISDGIVYGDDRAPFKKVTAVWALGNYKLRLRFSTGEERIFDVKPQLKYHVYKPLTDEALFNSVYLCYGVPTWQNGEIDFAPDTLYEDGIPYGPLTNPQ